VTAANVDSPPRFDGIAFLVCATQRSGSTLLCELLKGTEVAGVPDEFFEPLRSTGLPRQPRQYFEAPEVQDIAESLPPVDPGRTEQPGEFVGWFEYAIHRGTTPNGVFSAKMMWNYFDDFRARVRELSGLQDLTFNHALDRIFPQLRIVFVRRRDKTAQAVSLWRAIQTQTWRNAEDTQSRSPARYDYKAIKHLVEELHRWDAGWEDWFHATGRQPVRVIYEEFVGARAATLGRVLDGLGIPPRELADGKGPMRRQADDVSQDWVDRFRQENLDRNG
jgi:trehalose 2-sulfotransferase